MLDLLNSNDQKQGSTDQNNTNNPDPNYWRSFRELYNDPALIAESHDEFKPGVTDEFDPKKLNGLSRRKFLALVGASAALAGAGCNYRDKGEIIPYTKKPEEITIGQANYYASTINGQGVIVKTREGRPIKIDGNPDHPVSMGKIDSKTLASILNLYDPERLKHPLKGDGRGNFRKYDWIDADSEIINELSKAGGKEIAIISHSIISPTAKRIMDQFLVKYPSTRIYTYELFGSQVRDTAWQKFSGSPTFPLIKWNEAKVIVALESDFLGCGTDKIENTRLFTEGRNIKNLKAFNRLYVVEGNMSLTGMNADYRLKLRPDAQFGFVMALLNEAGRRGAGTFGSNNYSLNSVADKYKLNKERLNLLVTDLLNNRGSAIVHAGDEMPENVHIAVNMLNQALGNSAMYRTDTSRYTVLPLSSGSDFDNLISSMNSGNVAAIIHFDSNPVYHFPKDRGYAEALKKVQNVITLTELENESSALSHYVLPINHQLESWGDAKTRTGFTSLQQPVIDPLLNTRQKEAVLLTWQGGKADAYHNSFLHDFMMRLYRDEIHPASGSPLSFAQFWNGALHDGIITTTEALNAGAAFDGTALNGFNTTSTVTGYVLALKESQAIGDGRYANNGWLQELPHPVTKVTWDNYAAISPATANELGVDFDDIIRIKADNHTLDIPVYVQPGAADKTITIELGYGRSKTGTVGTGVGFNANVLMSKNGGLSPWLYTGVSVSKTGEKYHVVSAQEHHMFDNELTKDAALKRKIIREGTVQQYNENPHFLHEGKGEHLTTFYPDWKYPGLKWGMVIDQNKCIGCGECVIGCVSENNIPVVGKESVRKGREMHWIRVDRYYSGSADDPGVHNQVMLCQHCDHAPCENVCPVVATTHSPDGLNQMVYNRCVGTRYCSNNCPYKVRRFNYFNFRDHFNDSYQENALFNLIYNPEVTVRSRGVMEKCTFCVQRISHEKQDAAKENRQAKGSNVTTACQDACITNAISFGDVNERESEVAELRNHELAYHVLEEINTRPNVTYIAKLRNTHTKPGAKRPAEEGA